MQDKKVTVTKSYRTKKSGTLVTITGEVQLTKTINADGLICEDIPCCDIHVRVAIEGHPNILGIDVRSTDQLSNVSSDEYPYVYGKLLMTQEEYEIYAAVQAEIEAHPAWVAKQARIKKSNEAAEKAYKSRIDNGMCPRCQSWCYADCQAN